MTTIIVPGIVYNCRRAVCTEYSCGGGFRRSARTECCPQRCGQGIALLLRGSCLRYVRQTGRGLRERDKLSSFRRLFTIRTCCTTSSCLRTPYI